LELGPPVNRTEKFAVNVDPRESDLAALSLDDLTRAIAEGAGGLQPEQTRVTSAQPTMATEELSKWLLVSAFCLLLVEQMMAWRFQPGFAVLLLLVAAALTRHASVWHPAAGYAAAVVFVVVFGAVVVVRRRRAQAGPS
ncbi:MAG: hypothetical protein AB7O26_10050, partial [Planctomycetaceae bacterium]